MDGTGNTWIKRMDGTKNLKRSFRISNRITHERRLIGTELPFRITRAGIPGRRYDALVIFDLAVLDNNPV